MRLVALLLLGGCGIVLADPPGVVIDHSPAKTKQYVGSPSLAVLPSGEYVASHDWFGPGTNYDTMAVFASKDRGATWKKTATLKGQWWSTLFVHRKELYLIGTTKEYGHCVIRKSTDGGETWTEPKDKDTGLLHGDGKYHCAPVPLVIHDGRLWRAMEEYTGPKWGAFKAFVMSAPLDADLLKASSWTSTNRIGATADWHDGKITGVLEGNVTVNPEGKIVNLLRVHHPSFEEIAARMSVSADGKTLTFDPKSDLQPMPGGSKKFLIRYDEKSKRYWMLANNIPAEYRIDGRRPDQTRNTLSLFSSADLRTWELKKTILQNKDVKGVGFQYPDWLIDGDDLIAVVRTAFPEADGTPAHNPHDANWMTFHRIADFRK